MGDVLTEVTQLDFERTHTLVQRLRDARLRKVRIGSARAVDDQMKRGEAHFDRLAQYQSKHYLMSI